MQCTHIIFGILLTFALAITIGAKDVHECTSPGLLCRNCTLLVYCTPSSNNTWIPVQTCDPDKRETCLDNKCTTEPNPQCNTNDPYVFECTDVGVFPDPFDCQKYYFCYNDEGPPVTTTSSPTSTSAIPTKTTSQFTSPSSLKTPINDKFRFNPRRLRQISSVKAHPITCDDKYGYDMVSTYCKIPLAGSKCPATPPVPACKKMGQTGALANKSIYYICVMDAMSNIIPKLLLCPHGQIYESNICKVPK